jgi:hypothetical protein
LRKNTDSALDRSDGVDGDLQGCCRQQSGPVSAILFELATERAALFGAPKNFEELQLQLRAG